MNKMKERPDLLDKKSPGNIKVVQLTEETGVPSSHVYMEAQVFSSDSRRFLLHRAAYAHGPSGTGPNGTYTLADKRKFRDDPEHQYLLCDIENNCALSPLIAETGAIAPSVYADKYAYYFIDRTEVGGGSLTLKRVNLDGTGRQTVMVIDAAIPGTNYRPSFIYPLSTISSDGKRMALSCFLGDGSETKITWGLMVFDLEKASVRLVMEGPSWCNMHPQYCRSSDPEACHDILIQENHGNITGAQGQIQALTGGNGADIHVIRDDGTNFRDMPWGRDGNERCQGHQCWRGLSTWAITSTGMKKPPEKHLIESRPVPSADHLGSKTPGGIRNDLSRNFPGPFFWHFATDIEGRRLITDGCDTFGPDCAVYLADLGKPGTDPAGPFNYLLTPRCSCTKNSHLHPFLSPDGQYGFFNSDESGILQAYMVMLS
jgi:hypothetical protein